MPGQLEWRTLLQGRAICALTPELEPPAYDHQGALVYAFVLARDVQHRHDCPLSADSLDRGYSKQAAEVATLSKERSLQMQIQGM